MEDSFVDDWTLGLTEITRAREIVFSEGGVRLAKESAGAQFDEELSRVEETLRLAGELVENEPVDPSAKSSAPGPSLV